MKKAVAFSIALLMVFSVFVVFLGYTPHDSQSGDVNMPMVASSYHGNITIEPNGVINESPAGAPIKAISNGYVLTGNITGSITIERSSILLNGSGYVISSSSNSYSIGYLNITNASDISVTDLSVNASSSLGLPTVGVFLYNTSKDNLSVLNITASGAGIMISNSTSFVNITNSHISGAQSSSGGFLLGGVSMGAYLNMHLAGFGGPIAVNTTSNITLYSDNISSFQYGPPVASNSNNTVLKDSKISAANLAAPAAVMMIRNGSSVLDTSFNLNSTMAVNISNPFNLSISGLKRTYIVTIQCDVRSGIYSNGSSKAC